MNLDSKMYFKQQKTTNLFEFVSLDASDKGHSSKNQTMSQLIIEPRGALYPERGSRKDTITNNKTIFTSTNNKILIKKINISYK